MAKTSALVKKVLPRIKFHASGSYGTYGHYGSVGLKLIARSRYSACDKNLKPCEFDTRNECLGSRAYKLAKREANLIKRAGKRSSLPPRLYEVGIYKIGKKWYAGIFMEHIKGKLARKVRGWENREKIVDAVQETLENVGIEYIDRNDSNYIFDKIHEMWRVIDFTPGWVKFLKNQ